MPWHNGVMADARRTPFIPDAARAKAYLSWVGVITVVFIAVYPTINWFTETRAHRYRLYLPFELDIPLAPLFIWAYLSMYALFLMPLFMVSAERMQALGKQLAAGTILCGIVFLLLPADLGFLREVPSQPLYASIFSGLFGVDRPHNLMPSLHVVFSCLILFMCREGANVILRVLLFVWVVLIVASTVLVHQHHLIDALTGLAVTLLLRRYIRPKARSQPPGD